jgi:glycosyltransferase involved in cell wall biosynthesis
MSTRSGIEDFPLPAALPDGSRWPTISIVTPSLNQGRYLEDNIRSVLDQGYPHVEHLVIDGGSADQTGEVLRRYRDRLAYVVSEQDRGQSHAINKGLGRARGEIVTWLNADDQLAPGALASMALAFHYSGADLVAGTCRLLQGDQIIGTHLTGCPNGVLPLDDLLDLDGNWIQGRFFYQPEVMFTRELWNAAGGYVDESLYYSMDYEMWVRFAQAGARLHVIGAPIAIFRVHEQQKTCHPDKYLPELRRVNAEICTKLGVQPSEPMPAPSPATRPRVVLLNDVGFEFGAGIAHRRIGRALLGHGHQVSGLCLSGEGGTPGMAENNEVLAELERAQPDLVILGNLHAAKIDPHLIGDVASRWPTYQVLHDFWTVSGRCAYPGSCQRYKTGCDESCPTSSEYPPLDPDEIRKAWQTKQRMLASSDAPVLLAGSRFAEQKLLEMLPAQSVNEILPLVLGVPTDAFTPRDTYECRAALNLPTDAFVVLFSACSLDEPRKGLKYLLKALQQVHIPKLHLACVGEVRQLDEPLPEVTNLGYIHDEQQLASAYSAADIFVGPSLEETFGQVFVEAAACGTPSIAFRRTGATSAVVEGLTGLLVDEASPPALAAAIQQLHDDKPQRARLAALAPLYVRNERSLTAVYRSLHHIFERTSGGFVLQLPKSIAATRGPTLASPKRIVGSRCLVEFRSGFSKWTAADAERGVPRHRQAVEPWSALHVAVPKAGRYWLELTCLLGPIRQDIGITSNGRYRTRFRLPASRSGPVPHKVRIDLALSAGWHEVGLHLHGWSADPSAREQQRLNICDVALRRRFVIVGKKSWTSRIFREIVRPRRAA